MSARKRRHPTNKRVSPEKQVLPTEPVQTSYGPVELRLEGTQVLVLIDGVESSFMDLSDPAHLEFEYMQHCDVVWEAISPSPEPVQALHLGAGAGTLPRAWEAKRPGSNQVAVDINLELTTLSRQWFDLPRAPRLRIRAGDAREILESMRENRWDVIVRDVFAERSTPPHLRTVEFTQEISRTLRPAGVYLANLAAAPPLKEALSEISSIGAVFPYLAVIGDPKVLKGARLGNMIVAASRQPLPLTSIDKALRKLPLPAVLADQNRVSGWSQNKQFRDPVLTKD